jgi:predicted enzyme related to lactoylglutathione lyase
MTTTNTNSPSIKVVNWFEIPVTDIGRAAALYGAMLDRKLELSSFAGVPHAVFPHGDGACVSGALVSDAKRPPKRGNGTVIYLAATDGIASCLARAIEAGAKVVQPETSIAPHGSIALIEDLDGNVIGLHEEPKA